MATTTRYKIAEQVLRLVSGGNPSDDSGIDIRDVLALVDQERDAIIKREIGTNMAVGESEINGAWLTKEGLSVTSNSYVTLTSQPISLPNDMGVFRVAARPVSLTAGARTLTLSNIVASVTADPDSAKFVFSPGPTKLDSKYRISFTVTQALETGVSSEEQTHTVDFTVYPDVKKQASGQNIGDSRWSNISLLEAIMFSKEANDIMNGLHMYFGVGDESTSSHSELEISANFDFTITDFQINGSESGGDHGFYWTQSHTDGSTDSTPNSASLLVKLKSGNVYSVHYPPDMVRSVSAADVVSNFVDRNAKRMSIEDRIKLTGSGAVITFTEEIPQGGFNIDQIDVASSGVLGWSLQNVGAYTTDPDPTALENEEKIYTRMPSGGETNLMYHDTVAKTGRRYWFLEGNLIYLYKNVEPITTLDVHYIASSRTISDTAAYPLPADYEKEIITNLVQVFGLMKQAVEDITNDNIG